MLGAGRHKNSHWFNINTPNLQIWQSLWQIIATKVKGNMVGFVGFFFVCCWFFFLLPTLVLCNHLCHLPHMRSKSLAFGLDQFFWKVDVFLGKLPSPPTTLCARARSLPPLRRFQVYKQTTVTTTVTMLSICCLLSEKLCICQVASLSLVMVKQTGIEFEWQNKGRVCLTPLHGTTILRIQG